jgi:hypothetical protein
VRLAPIFLIRGEWGHVHVVIEIFHHGNVAEIRPFFGVLAFSPIRI